MPRRFLALYDLVRSTLSLLLSARFLKLNRLSMRCGTEISTAHSNLRTTLRWPVGRSHRHDQRSVVGESKVGIRFSTRQLDPDTLIHTHTGRNLALQHRAVDEFQVLALVLTVLIVRSDVRLERGNTHRAVVLTQDFDTTSTSSIARSR